MIVVCRFVAIVGVSAVRGRSGAAAKFGEITFKDAAPVRERTNADLWTIQPRRPSSNETACRRPCFFGLCASAVATTIAAKLPLYVCARCRLFHVHQYASGVNNSVSTRGRASRVAQQQELSRVDETIAGSRTHPLSTRPVCVRLMTRGLQSNGA